MYIQNLSKVIAFYNTNKKEIEFLKEKLTFINYQKIVFINNQFFSHAASVRNIEKIYIAKLKKLYSPISNNVSIEFYNDKKIGKYIFIHY